MEKCEKILEPKKQHSSNKNRVFVFVYWDDIGQDIWKRIFLLAYTLKDGKNFRQVCKKWKFLYDNADLERFKNYIHTPSGNYVLLFSLLLETMKHGQLKEIRAYAKYEVMDVIIYDITWKKNKYSQIEERFSCKENLTKTFSQIGLKSEIITIENILNNIVSFGTFDKKYLPIIKIRMTIDCKNEVFLFLKEKEKYYTADGENNYNCIVYSEDIQKILKDDQGQNYLIKCYNFIKNHCKGFFW